MPFKNHFLLQPLQFSIKYIAHAHISPLLALQEQQKEVSADNGGESSAERRQEDQEEN